MTVIERLNAWSRRLKSEALTVWYISKHPQTPWYPRMLAFGLVAHAFSPIDLISDFSPVLGYVDDVIVGLLIMLRMTPKHVIAECRGKARAHMGAQVGRPRSRLGRYWPGWAGCSLPYGLQFFGKGAFSHTQMKRVGHHRHSIITTFLHRYEDAGALP
jgi:uncharacterized membrane protein YkvA (DUF1232 family)